MSTIKEDLRRMVLLPEAKYNSLCEKNPGGEPLGEMAVDAPHTSSNGVLDDPREALRKHLERLQNQIQELDASIAIQHPNNATAHLQRSQLESKLLQARRILFQPPPALPADAGGTESRMARASLQSLDDSGVPKAQRARFRRLAERLFSGVEEASQESGQQDGVVGLELGQEEIKNLMEYVVRDKPLKRHVKRPPSGLENFLEFLRKREVDPSLVGKHLRNELNDGRVAAAVDSSSGDVTPRVDNGSATLEMLENYETIS